MAKIRRGSVWGFDNPDDYYEQFETQPQNDVLAMMTHKTSMMTIVNIGKVVAMGERESERKN